MIQNLIVLLAEEAHLACGIHVGYISVLALRKPAAIAEKSATVGLAGGGEIATIANNQPHTIFVQGSAQFV
jgi:hypothetical protein